MPFVRHEWSTDGDDPSIETWGVYASTDKSTKGVCCARVPYGEMLAEFELTEGTWFLRVLGKFKDGSEHDWQTAFIATEVIDAQAQEPPSVVTTDEEVPQDIAPAVAEIAPERSVSVTLDPQPRDETPAKVQIIQGDDPNTGKLVAETPPPPARGPVGDDGSRQPTPPIPVEGLGRTGDRKYTVRAMTKGGIPAQALNVKTETMPPSPEQTHYPVEIASVTPAANSGMYSPTDRGYSFDPTHGVLLDEVPDIASLGATWGASISAGRLAELPAFAPYQNKAKILTAVYDLGADALGVPYIVDCFDDLQRYSVNGWDAVIDIAGLSPYPFHPASDENVRPLPPGVPWAAREVLTGGNARQPLRNWKWQVFTLATTFNPSIIPDASWINHVPGRIYSGRFIAARLVVEEPVSWWRLKVPHLSVRVMFQTALGADAGGTPETRIKRPPASMFVDTATGKVYVKTSGVGNTGWVEMSPASAGGVPTGTILPYGAAAAPTGYLLCDGTAYSVITYAALFAVIGLTFGNSGGPGTFDVPNLLDRFPQGRGGSNAIGTSGGNVAPPVTDPGHAHATVANAARGPGAGVVVTLPPGPTAPAATGVTIADGRPPFQTVNYIIKT